VLLFMLYDQAGTSRLTVSRLIWVSGLKRCWL
jgi:hypothetical protein